MQPFDAVREEIQAALRKAHVLRKRGDAAGAEAAIQEVISAHPEHPDALEAKAEFLIEQNKLKEARDLLADVIKQHAGRIATERKHAELVLRVAQKEMVVTAALSGNLNSLNPAGVRRGAGTSAFLNIMLPGFGQIYNGELYKGIAFAVVAVGLWIALFTLGLGQKSQPTTAFWPITVCLLTVYVVTILDAAVAASKAQPSAIPERPIPPVDKPFE